MYTNCGSVDFACRLFDKMFDFNVVSCNAMMSGYLKVGDLGSARSLFDKMPERDLVSWSTVIAGCVQLGDIKKALELFTEMQDLRIRADEVILASLLSASAQMGALYRGKWFHAYIYRSNVKLDVVLSTSLIDMYSKCGGVDIALRVFRLMPKKDTLAWNAIITGLAMNGCGEKSLGVFLEMQSEGKRPDDVTFIGVLCACSHAGLLDEGFRYFECMTRDYRINPRIEHYGCMVDLLGRAGLLEDAQDFISRMPVEPNAAIWGALLGGCIIHGNVELGECVGRLLIELEPHHSGRYVLLSNLYANANRWDDARNIREMMKEKGVQKIPGQSTIEAMGAVHEFVMGDRSHPQTKEIYHMLDEMAKQLTLAGYTPDTSKVLFNLDEEDKENALGYHSEKLAIAFGLINLGPNTPIRIVKNLRVCVDCHSVTKLISKIYGRKIIVRDRNRFHHFQEGYCSCKDYW
ncbi:pentatricopeptide repeat-containing protein At5g48910-like isoform X2 [Magnolia sinica]|nr:pentatricopeptide repeat-containing protein At5g48910-like isoform X2 [Magnolia sinica]